MRTLSRLLTLLLAITLGAPAAHADGGRELIAGETIVFPDAALTFDARFELTRYETPRGVVSLSGLTADAGVDGAFSLGTLEHRRFWDLNTWNLARVTPAHAQPGAQEILSAAVLDDRVEVVTLADGMEFTRVYTPGPFGLRVDVRITSRRPSVSAVQGIALLARGIELGEDASFRFPGNAPYGVYRVGGMREYAPVQAAYCAPVLRVDDGAAGGYNLLFLNEQEKWATGVWRGREGALTACFLAMAEGLLAQGESWDAGPMYIQVTGATPDPYSMTRALYAENGWVPPADGVSRVGPMYEAHPHGTMDSGFRDRYTLDEFARVLPGLSDMGVENVWLLPVFGHGERGVYDPFDQAVIDPRYGGDAGLRAFAQAADARNIRVLLDYVPHGPRPEDPLALAHPEWCSVHRTGRLQIEWDSVSFDMANPAYQAYTTALVEDHILRFGTEGGRIDCAMGGLPNWNPSPGNRASSSGIFGGRETVRAIREAFTRSGRAPLLLPENFHPLPFYAPVTDVFYDMPLYRVMFDMREDGLGEADFAKTLARWLEDEYQSGVPDQRRLRFLGNHDTVSWTWDEARPTAVYGVEKAKALWTLFSLIDGVPFLYQGDEDTALYDRRIARVDLREFFRGLFAARAAFLSEKMGILYHHNDSAVVAFTRSDGQTSRLALVNLGSEPAEYPLPRGTGEILYGQGAVEDGSAVLGPYESLLLRADPIPQ